ncbi:MAG: DUF6206 family protein [Desulfobacterales bacterium]|jgi:hypothetical protein
MLADENRLAQFEIGLDPQNLDASPIPATIIGYGEISAIFQIADHPEVAFKRLPLFSDRSAAQTYVQQYHEYCRLLTEAGLRLPDHQTYIIQPPGRPTAVYIAQKKLPSERFGHQLIHDLAGQELQSLLERIVRETDKIWRFNQSARPALELALDGQLSNWVWLGNADSQSMVFIDTSTPLFRKNGVEQLDPELFLKSAPAFLRWILRLFFLDDVINRYYDQRLVCMDLAANLYKEQQPALIPLTVKIINTIVSDNMKALTEAEVAQYYRQDKLIWTLFLAFRRLDRWVTTKLFRRRYEFILPGKIKR